MALKFWSRTETGGWTERDIPAAGGAPDAAAAAVTPRYFVGLDLGQLHDFSALGVVEQVPAEPELPVYRVRHLQRWPLHTPYPTIVQNVVALWQRPPLAGRARLVADATGCGLPVADLLRPHVGSYLVPALITSGAQATQDGQLWHVPKQTLIATAQVLLQTQRLKVAGGLREAATLLHELQGYQQKVTASANLVYGAWREGAHDDVLLAVALAVWYAEAGPRPTHFY
jgi:hypothetical protein